MINLSSAVFYVMMTLGAGFMIWVLWKTVADERRRHHDHHTPIRRY
jgi:threonine/homoserine/homoserine lactone efflux protein